MLAWPHQEFARVGDEVTLVAVASTATDANGAFELRTAQTPALQSLAAQNGGYLNLVLRAADEPTGSMPALSTVPNPVSRGGPVDRACRR